MNRLLDVAVPQQNAANWRRAAVSLGIHEFYWRPATFGNQRQVAAETLRLNCFRDRAPCDRTHTLESAIHAVRCLDRAPVLGAVRPEIVVGGHSCADDLS